MKGLALESYGKKEKQIPLYRKKRYFLFFEKIRERIQLQAARRCARMHDTRGRNELIKLLNLNVQVNN